MRQLIDVVLVLAAVACFVTFGMVRRETVRGPETNYERLTIGLPSSPWYEKVTRHGPKEFGFEFQVNYFRWSSLFLIGGVVLLWARDQFRPERTATAEPTA